MDDVIAAAQAVVEMVDEERANGGHVAFLIADKVLDLKLALEALKEAQGE